MDLVDGEMTLHSLKELPRVMLSHLKLLSRIVHVHRCRLADLLGVCMILQPTLTNRLPLTQILPYRMTAVFSSEKTRTRGG